MRGSCYLTKVNQKGDLLSMHDTLFTIQGEERIVNNMVHDNIKAWNQ
jgi:hypothetical protein